MTTELYGCILIGGKSSRMGQPKQLILQKGTSWFEIIHLQLSAVCQNIIAAGSGELPPGKWNRVSDANTCTGPLSGIVAAMESKPKTNFIVCSCDLPHIKAEAIRWLVQQYDTTTWAVIPSLESGFLEPLFAYYDFRILPFLKNLSQKGSYRLSDVASHDRVKVVHPPVHLHSAWKNCNTLDDLKV